MKNITLIWIFFILSIASVGQKRNEVILNAEYCKQITEYYCKQFIFDSLLKIPANQVVEFYVTTVAVAKSGELSVSFFDCSSLKKKGVVFTFWNRYPNYLNDNTQGYAFYFLDLDKATELFKNLETIINKEYEALKYTNGNLVFKVDDLTFLFYKDSDLNIASYPIRVWWGKFDADWGQENLRTTIMRFRKYFGQS